MATLLNAVVVDLSRHPDVQYAVVLAGQLLPIRFAREAEATIHLAALLETMPGLAGPIMSVSAEAEREAVA